MRSEGRRKRNSGAEDGVNGKCGEEREMSRIRI
jgi:hypothetical protein